MRLKSRDLFRLSLTAPAVEKLHASCVSRPYSERRTIRLNPVFVMIDQAELYLQPCLSCYCQIKQANTAPRT